MAGKEDTIKTTLAVDGEKEYKAACKEINSSLRLIGSEMKVVTAEFGNNTKSIDGLTAKQGVLHKQLDEQSKKVKAAEDALKKMREDGVDPSSPAYQKMETALNNTTAEMIKTQKEIEGTDKELEEAQKGAGEFGKEVKKTGDETEAAGGKFSKVGDVLGKVGKAFGVALAALGTAAVGAATGLAKLTVDAADFADDLMTQSTYTRQSTDDLQKYAYACRFIDTDMDTLTKTMAKNIKSMDAARGGTGATAEAYKKLGVNVTNADGTLKDSNDVYWEAIDALGGVQNETERDAMAMQLFGKSAQELNSVIGAGSEAFKAYGDEAAAVGAVMGEDQLQKLGEFKDKLDTLEASMDGLKNSASLIALPFLDVMASDGIKILGDFSKGINEANGDISKMGDVIGKGIGDVLNLIVEQLPEFVNMGVEMVKSLVKGLAGNASTLATSAVKIVETLVDGIAELLPLIINGAVQIIIGLAQGLGKSLPRLIPQVITMITTIVQTLVDNIPLLVEAALQLVTGLADGILAAIPVLIKAIPKIIAGIVNALTSAIPQIIQAGIQLFTSIIGALPQIITAIVAAIPQIVSSLVTAIVTLVPQIIQAWIKLLTSLVQALPQIITAIVEAIPQIINSLVTALMESIPIIIQAGIDLLVALIQALPTIITTIVKAIPQIIGSIVNALVGNIDKIIMAGVQIFVALIENLPTIIIEIVKAVPQIIAGIVEAFGSLAYKIVEIGGNLLKGIWEGISNAASWLWEKITGFFSGIVDGIKNFLGIHSPSTVFAQVGGNMAAGVGEGFGDEMGGVEGDMTAAMGGAGALTAKEAVNAVNNGIIANIGALDAAVKAIVERVVNGLEAQAQRLNNIGKDIDKYISSGMVSGITSITSAVPQLVQSIITAFVAQHPKFTTEGTDIDKAIASGMVSGIPQITAKVPQVVQPIITALKSFASEFVAAGEEMVRGIWEGFQNLSGWLESKVRSMMRQIVRAVKDEMDISSPSKVFGGIGAYMAEGLGDGFSREMQDVEKTIRKATASTVPDVPKTSGKLPRSEGGVQVVQNIYANETSYAKQQREAAKQFKMIAREVMA